MIHDVSLRLLPEQAAHPDTVRREAIRMARVSNSQVNDIRIVRRSIDARRKPVVVNLGVKIATGPDNAVAPVANPPRYLDVTASSPTVIIVGAGPAGLFAALKALSLGIRPIVLERGEDVDTRRRTIADISRKGVVNPDSNYSFGEGGAGAYSDGKLYTRSKKRGNVAEVLAMFHHHGAKEDILIDAHPHIGSDRLPGIIKDMRQTIIAHGGDVRFGTRISSIIIEKGRAVGVTDSEGNTYLGDGVVLATGHSARDVYRMLHAAGIGIEAKSLAIGIRLEHPQHLIDSIQYHNPKGRGKWLPAAEYSFVTQADGRGVYSFCMCPGGVIVPAATAPAQLVVNGMSAAARNSQWANSGMVVEVHPDDFPEYAQHGPLSMMVLQEDLEKRWFDASGGTLNAPAQRMTDFVAGRDSHDLPRSSYAPGVHPARIDMLLPPFIARRLQKGFEDFGRKSRGFLSHDAILVGLESRTSSPVRIPRTPDTLQHITVSGLYPAGEGAGYAGGIVSAAIDGMRCIEAFANSLNPNENGNNT